MVSDIERRRYIFRGTVQGVGFRPTVFRVATALSLSGFVQNRRSEVCAEVEGPAPAVARFAALLRESLPPAAHLDGMEESMLPSSGNGREPFRIAESAPSAYRFPPIPPDLAVCPECARELLDPADRRYLYPFITCTQCGPRYSIVESTPFDRVTTSMREFAQCPLCLAEYTNPADRRFHSQTNSCAACGPRLSCVDRVGREAAGDPVEAAIAALNRGMVVAVQGIGGFHMAVDPSNPAAMARLRASKERERKPFALMTAGIEEARRLCVLTGEEERILLSPESPIVISLRRPEAPGHLAEVSDTDTLGVMLPYTPLHMLLFRHPRSRLCSPHLVMTSGNRAGEPIVIDPGEALSRLGDTADLFLTNNRRIVFRTDDSIMRRGEGSPSFLFRRSRGYVPRLVSLAHPVAGTVLGVGGDLKSAPALARGPDVHLSPYLGDLDDAETFTQFDRHVRGLLALYGATVDLIVHDTHPLYRSTQWAEGQAARRVAVQHHYAHLLSVMAEHGLEEAIGLAFDGTGHGTDGAIWGGEFLHATRTGFRRLGSFAPFPLPGGDSAVRHPPRIAFALLAGPLAGPRARAAAGSLPGLDARERRLVGAMLEKGLNTPSTTSLGRIFDAAAAALGLVETASYEGEGPIRLEGRALRERARGGRRLEDTAAAELLPVSVTPGAEPFFQFDAAPLVGTLLERSGSESVETLALLFHEAIAWASREGARKMRAETGVEKIALSGGVFQNLLLRELLIPLLRADGLEVFVNQKVPPGDGGLSLGQVYHVPE